MIYSPESSGCNTMTQNLTFSFNCPQTLRSPFCQFIGCLFIQFLAIFEDQSCSFVDHIFREKKKKKKSQKDLV